MSEKQVLKQAKPFGGEALMRTALFLARHLPRRVGYPLVEFGGRVIGRLSTDLRAILESNLVPVLPDKGPRERRQVAIEVFAHFARAYYEALYIPFVSAEQLIGMIKVGGPGWEPFQEAYQGGQGTIVVSTHQSSFDLAGHFMAAKGYPPYVLALPEQEAGLAFILKLRERQGIRVLPLGPRALRESLRHLRAGGVLAMAADRPMKDQGTEVEFFGRPTILPDGHVRLALQTGALIFGTFVYREDGEYHFRFVPLDLVRSGDKEADIRENVQRIARMIEEPILAHPEQWHLFRRLWED
jgi:KDO2-lipid IV(A) lauroyltransferase